MTALLKFIVYLFAIYGALMLILSILGTIRARLHLKDSKLKLVLVVKNAGEYIEYIVRDMAKRVLADRAFPVDSLTVVDMNSEDETRNILEKLRNDFDFIELLSEKEKEKTFCNF